MRSIHSTGEPDPIIVAARPLADRVLARVFGASLDDSLAAGSAPESSRLLAVRAQDIVSLRRRMATAANWERLLRVAQAARQSASGPPARRWGARPAAMPVCARQIVAAEPAIRELVSCLSMPLPVPAQGVAMARVLLTDATGPVYNARSRVSLATALDAAITYLDPALPLMPSAPSRR
jgi:hypothetical protein